MSAKTIIIIACDLLILIILIKLIFKTYKNFFRSIYYVLYPDILSVLKKDFDNDFKYTYKLILLLILLFVIIVIEVSIFY